MAITTYIDPYQPYGKDTATCVRCFKLFNASLAGDSLVCKVCESKIDPGIKPSNEAESIIQSMIKDFELENNEMQS